MTVQPKYTEPYKPVKRCEETNKFYRQRQTTDIVKYQYAHVVTYRTMSNYLSGL